MFYNVFFLRRTKTTVSLYKTGLKGKNEVIIWLNLQDWLKPMYEAIKTASELEMKHGLTSQLLTYLTRESKLFNEYVKKNFELAKYPQIHTQTKNLKATIRNSASKNVVKHLVVM